MLFRPIRFFLNEAPFEPIYYPACNSFATNRLGQQSVAVPDRSALLGKRYGVFHGFNFTGR